MHKWARDLFPICRSITGNGTRQTLDYLQNLLPGFEVHSIPSGSQVFDWIVPDEWTIKDAYIMDKSGQKIIDFQNNNLHIIGYSESVDKWLDLEELDPHLFSLPDQPDAIPYITSYYSRNWGFCLTHNQHKKLQPGQYRAVVDAEIKPGELNYGELIIKGNSKKEVFLSTYICHPSMANNELSGPVVTVALAQWLKSLEQLRYTYRIIFIPETIGSIVYLSRNLDYLKEHVIAGFNITCIGDERCYSYLPSRDGNTFSDKVALHVLNHIDNNFLRYTWLDRGSDERQYCAPGVDLPIATIMRSKYGNYPEYHTSLDNFELVTSAGLAGGFDALKKSIEIIENNNIPKLTMLCEPQLGKRGLYPLISTKNRDYEVERMMNMLTYCDGNNSLIDIGNKINVPAWELIPIANILIKENILKI